MDCSIPDSSVLHCLPEFAQIHVHELVMLSNHLILCLPLLLLPSVFPSIRIFYSERCIRWPEYWSFSFSISPFNEYSGLISFRIDWFHLLAVQGTFKSLEKELSDTDFSVCFIHSFINLTTICWLPAPCPALCCLLEIRNTCLHVATL